MLTKGTFVDSSIQVKPSFFGDPVVGIERRRRRRHRFGRFVDTHRRRDRRNRRPGFRAVLSRQVQVLEPLQGYQRVHRW